MAGLVVTKIVREVSELRISLPYSAQTIGELIDIRIQRAISDAEELSDIEVSFTKEDWEALVEGMGLTQRNNR